MYERTKYNQIADIGACSKILCPLLARLDDHAEGCRWSSRRPLQSLERTRHTERQQTRGHVSDQPISGPLQA